MMAQDVEVAPSFQPLLGLAANFLGSHESQVADPMIEAFFGTVQIPVDSVHATSGGRKMVITHEIHWIDHHRTPQRQHHEVYQTP